MKSKRKDTIKQRVTSRFKGLGAIMLALFMILTDMSLMPPVEAEAATGDQYWIIGYVFYSDPLFCTGQESNYISGNVYEVLDDTNNNMDNGYVRYYSGFKLSEGSPLKSLGTLSNSGLEITISPEEDTYVNAGCVQRNKGSGMLFQMKVDGTVKAETTGLGEEEKAKFLLDAGKYAVKYTRESLAGNGIKFKYIVDFESVIDSLTVTPADATLTFGGSTQTLTVSPASAADKVEWSSEDTKIATVDSDGTVTPVSAGTVTIKATYTPEEGDPIVGTCKVTVNKAESTVAKIPTAKNLTYNGKAQELVIAGTATGGTMQYALGTKDAATQPYNTSIPTATDAGTYYVWYKAKGNEGYKDSDAKCVTATIDAAPSGGAVDGRGGAVTTEQLKRDYGEAEVKQGSSAAKAGITNASAAIDALQNEDRKVTLLGSAVECGGADVVVKNEGETRSELVTSKAAALAAVLTPQEMVEAVIGNKKVDVILEVQQTQAPDDQAKNDIESKKNADEQVVYINVNLFVEKDGKRDPNPVTEAKNDLKITFVIPESIRGEGRTFRLIWSHKNADSSLETSIYNDEDNDPNTFTVSVNKLSTVGLTYTTGSVTPTYTPSYSSGSSYTGSSYSSGSSGGGGGSGTSYIVASSRSSKGYYDKIGKSSVEYVSPKISKKAKVAKVPAKIKIGKKTYKVTAVSPYAFTGQDGLRTVIIGKNVKRISPYAFYGCDKLKVLRVRSRSLTAKKIRNCLKGSGIERVVVLKRAHNKFKFYKKIFTKKITGASTKLSVTRQK